MKRSEVDAIAKALDAGQTEAWQRLGPSAAVPVYVVARHVADALALLNPTFDRDEFFNDADVPAYYRESGAV